MGNSPLEAFHTGTGNKAEDIVFTAIQLSFQNCSLLASLHSRPQTDLVLLQILSKSFFKFNHM